MYNTIDDLILLQSFYVSSACVHLDHYNFSQYEYVRTRNAFIYGQRYRGRIRASSSCLFANNAITRTLVQAYQPNSAPPGRKDYYRGIYYTLRPDSVAQAQTDPST
ncbi:hypothetical protein EMCRGX_G024534 [Ephydatia muelleri]